MKARYIIRLDDACPTMRRETWYPLERALDELGIRPIVGVIPENRDPGMECGAADPEFWNRVRQWQKKGWSIALHGLHHLYHPIPAGKRALVPLHSQSEFVGRSLDVQRDMIRRAYMRFASEGVQPNMFMAPSHTFDANTLAALKLETPIRVVTDGYFIGPRQIEEFTWIPQQLWRLRPMPLGLWTVALHPNTMSDAAVAKMVADLEKFSKQIVDPVSALTLAPRRIGMADRSFCAAFLAALRLKRGRV